MGPSPEDAARSISAFFTKLSDPRFVPHDSFYRAEETTAHRDPIIHASDDSRRVHDIDATMAISIGDPRERERLSFRTY